MLGAWVFIGAGEEGGEKKLLRRWMESSGWWVDAGYDGESKQEKCRCAEQTDGLSLAGRKLPQPPP